MPYTYHIIAKEIFNNITSKRYKSGDKLPSIRTLSREYSCSIGTIIKALEELKAQGIIYAIPQSGYYIGRLSQRPTTSKTEIIDFTLTTPDPSLFPYREFQHCINQAIEEHKDACFSYGTMMGYDKLRESMVKLLFDEGCYVKKEQLVITTGSQQAISILFRLFTEEPGKAILIEQPTYPLVVSMIEKLGYPVHYITRTDDGYDMERLEALFREGNIRCFYCMPRVHNPLGNSLSEQTKRKLIRLAYKYHVYLIEDDYMADFVTDRKNRTLYSYDENFSQVIYIRSFSKSIFPGLRVGMANLPKELASIFAERKVFEGLDSAMLSQTALYRYIENGMFVKHNRKMQQLYNEKGRQLHKAVRKIARETNAIKGYYDGNTIHTCLLMNRRIHVDYFMQKNIRIASIDASYLEDYPKKEALIPISVSAIKTDRLQESLEAFAKVI